MFPLRGFKPRKLSNVWNPGPNSVRLYERQTVGARTPDTVAGLKTKNVAVQQISRSASGRMPCRREIITEARSLVAGGLNQPKTRVLCSTKSWEAHRSVGFVRHSFMNFLTMSGALGAAIGCLQGSCRPADLTRNRVLFEGGCYGRF